jgi:membrane protease YdiL (CAAX protease family)
MGSPRLMFALMAAMLVFTWIRGVTGSVWPAIAAHVAFNSVDIVPTILGKPEIEPTRTLLIASGAVAVTSLIGMSFLARTDRAITARQQDAGEVPL